MPATSWGWEITPAELEGWIVERTPELIVFNKPPHVVCHPSRYGPWSSLIGAAREYLGVTRLHMPSRLDRETSGVLVCGIEEAAGKRLHHAVQRLEIRKTYVAVVEGDLRQSVTVDQPIGRDESSEFYSRQCVVAGGQPAVTEFIPVAHAPGHTMVRVQPTTGRRHQIRVHAEWLGYPLLGDKLYGRDPNLMLRWMGGGLAEGDLAFPRQALHAEEVSYAGEVFRAPLADDIVQLWRSLSSEGGAAFTLPRLDSSSRLGF